MPPDGIQVCQVTVWVNPSTRGGTDGVFQPEGNPEEQPCQPEGNPIHPNSFIWIYIQFKIGHFGDISYFFKYLCLKKHNSR